MPSVKRPTSFKNRLIALSGKLRRKLNTAPGPERGKMLKKVQVGHTAIEIDRLTNSHDLKPPQ